MDIVEWSENNINTEYIATPVDIKYRSTVVMYVSILKMFKIIFTNKIEYHTTQEGKFPKLGVCTKFATYQGHGILEPTFYSTNSMYPCRNHKIKLSRSSVAEAFPFIYKY